MTNLSFGHAITARYYSDTTHAASSGSLQVFPPVIDQMVMLTNGDCQISFANAPAATFTVLTATELSGAPVAWTELGQATEILPGQYQFNVPPALSYDTARYYCVRSP